MKPSNSPEFPSPDTLLILAYLAGILYCIADNHPGAKWTGAFTCIAWTLFYAFYPRE